MAMAPLSVLDLCVVPDGVSSARALADTTTFAQEADRLGCGRFWVAEHHNMASVASTSPAVLMGHLAASTQQIRLGSGGVMLPNHAPLVIAEQFAMLEALHPGRIDLGIGRAPGTDRMTAMALRRTSDGREDDEFPNNLIDLMALLGDVRTDDGLHQHFRATPAARTSPWIGLLGSSGFSAQLAGMLGLPFGFAHHFGMGGTSEACDIYRQHFRPSPVLEEPYLIVTSVAVAAETPEGADRLLAPHRLFKYGLHRGRRLTILGPDDAMAHPDYEAAVAAGTNAVWGTADNVRGGLIALAEEHGASEIMVTVPIADLEARCRSLRLTVGAWERELITDGVDASPAPSSVE